MKQNDILESNRNNYEELYQNKKGFLQYPADWLIRFHNMYMRQNLPSGRVLDYGYGSGNNSSFFLEKGYDVYGTEVADSARELLRQNLNNKNIKAEINEKFIKISPDNVGLPFADNFFDFIFSNQVFYYLPSEEHIKKVCHELKRVLRPGGVVYFTMIGAKNYYITDHTKSVQNKIHNVVIDRPGHRLNGVHEIVYVVSDEAELKKLFQDFKCLSVGYFDQSMLDMKSNFHWIFIGQKD